MYVLLSLLGENSEHNYNSKKLNACGMDNSIWLPSNYTYFLCVCVCVCVCACVCVCTYSIKGLAVGTCEKLEGRPKASLANHAHK